MSELEENIGLTKQSTSCRFAGTLRFPSVFFGNMAVFDKTDPLKVGLGFV